MSSASAAEPRHDSLHGAGTTVDRARPASAPASAPLGPGHHVVDRAEGVEDAVLAAVADEIDTDIGERLPALGAGRRLGVPGRRRGRRAARVPMGALHAPGDHMLEPAERGSALAGRLRGPVAVAGLDGYTAPAAPLFALCARCRGHG